MFFLESTKESGAIVIDGHHAAATQQCKHCGSHEVIRKGSGKRRGWCLACGGFLCGKEFCLRYCIPHEARIEWQEALSQKRYPQINKLSTKYPHLLDLLPRNERLVI